MFVLFMLLSNHIHLRLKIFWSSEEDSLFILTCTILFRFGRCNSSWQALGPAIGPKVSSMSFKLRRYFERMFISLLESNAFEVSYKYYNTHYISNSPIEVFLEVVIYHSCYTESCGDKNTSIFHFTYCFPKELHAVGPNAVSFSSTCLCRCLVSWKIWVGNTIFHL